VFTHCLDVVSSDVVIIVECYILSSGTLPGLHLV
jgi:hypothetical protein